MVFIDIKEDSQDVVFAAYFSAILINAVMCNFKKGLPMIAWVEKSKISENNAFENWFLVLKCLNQNEISQWHGIIGM